MCWVVAVYGWIGLVYGGTQYGVPCWKGLSYGIYMYILLVCLFIKFVQIEFINVSFENRIFTKGDGR